MVIFKYFLVILFGLLFVSASVNAARLAADAKVFGLFSGPGTVWSSPKRYVKAVKQWNDYCPPCRLKSKAQCGQRPCQSHNIVSKSHDAAIQVSTDAWIRLANHDALLSAKRGGGPFAAVILQIDDRSGKIIRYWVSQNAVAKSYDPTAHAEIMTIRMAAKDLAVDDLGHINKVQSKLSQPHTWSHCIIYSSSEPCPMCLSAIYWAGIKNLYFSATYQDAAAKGVNFSDRMIDEELKLPYQQRKHMAVRRAVDASSLDAFNYFKRNSVPRYGQASTLTDDA